ncbi:hypothetical protein [Mesotoga prima]|uniref:hypothetical protein n=1 Tax=Mesotoga prima TaxID=1184387 RepID=UPI002FD9F368
MIDYVIDIDDRPTFEKIAIDSLVETLDKEPSIHISFDGKSILIHDDMKIARESIKCVSGFDEEHDKSIALRCLLAILFEMFSKSIGSHFRISMKKTEYEAKIIK